MSGRWSRARYGLAVIVVAPLLLNAARSGAIERPQHRVSVAAPARGHSRLIFAAGEEDSTLSGFTSGKVAASRSYWSVRRDLHRYTPVVWRLLERNKAWLTVNIRWRRDFGPVPSGVPHFGELLPFLRTARRHHVGVIAWLTVPYGDGYWTTEDNLAEYRRVVRRFESWAARVRFHPKAVLLDLEAPLKDSATTSQALNDPMPAIRMLDRNVGPAHQCAAMQHVQQLAAGLQAHGYPAVAAAYPFLFDDITDSNLALSDGLDMPVPQPGAFREVAFMAMRSAYASLIGTDPGSSLLASYIAAMKRWYGRTATFSLGVAGDGPYQHHLGRLVTDVRLAAALTSGTVGVYSLERALKAYGSRGVAKLFAAVRHPLAGAALSRASAISPGTREARAILGTMNDMVTAGLPLATASRGSPQLPTPWPTRC